MFGKVLTKIKIKYKMNTKKTNKSSNEDGGIEMSIFERKNNIITYTVNKAINRDVYITVQNGEVVVNAPWYFTPNKIQEKVQEKKNWILNQLKAYEQENLSSMRTVKILGRNYDVKVEYKNIKTPELNLQENSEIKITLPNKYKKMGNEQILKMAIDKMFEQVAHNEIEEIMEKTRIKLGIAPEEYYIKRMKDTLGKCTNEKTIIINPELMQYKREVVEYVVMHEFCHLKYKSHGKRFYEIIEKYNPNYRKYEKEIQQYQY